VGLWLRNEATKLLALPYLGKRILHHELNDAFTPPRYAI
jgi:hypothetical protein